MCKYIVNKFEQVQVGKVQCSKYPCGRGSDVTYQKLGQISWIICFKLTTRYDPHNNSAPQVFYCKEFRYITLQIIYGICHREDQMLSLG